LTTVNTVRIACDAICELRTLASPDEAASQSRRREPAEHLMAGGFCDPHEPAAAGCPHDDGDIVVQVLDLDAKEFPSGLEVVQQRVAPTHLLLVRRLLRPLEQAPALQINTAPPAGAVTVPIDSSAESTLTAAAAAG
jgi:hypothetical protein